MLRSKCSEVRDGAVEAVRPCWAAGALRPAVPAPPPRAPRPRGTLRPDGRGGPERLRSPSGPAALRAHLGAAFGRLPARVPARPRRRADRGGEGTATAPVVETRPGVPLQEASGGESLSVRPDRLTFPVR